MLPTRSEQPLDGDLLARDVAQLLLGLVAVLEHLLVLLFGHPVLLLLLVDDLRDLLLLRQEPLLVGALEEDFLLDQLVEHLQARRRQFERGELGLLTADLLVEMVSTSLIPISLPLTVAATFSAVVALPLPVVPQAAKARAAAAATMVITACLITLDTFCSFKVDDNGRRFGGRRPGRSLPA